METIALGTQGLMRSPARDWAAWACPSSTARATTPSRSPPSTAPSSSGVDLLRHGRHVRAVQRTRSWSAGRCAGRRDEVVLATKFGIVRDPDDPANARRQRPARVRAPGLRGESCSGSASSTSTSTTSTGSTRTRPIEETVGAMAELVGRGQGALPRALRGGAGHHPPRARRPPDRRAADRVLAVDPRPRGRGSSPPAASWASASSPTARSAAASSPGRLRSLDDLAAGRLPPLPAALLGRQPAANLASSSVIDELAAAKGCTPAQLALAWVLAQGDDVAPIPGTKRRRYLEENVGALDVELTEEDLAVLDAVAPARGDRYADMSPRQPLGPDPVRHEVRGSQLKYRTARSRPATPQAATMSTSVQSNGVPRNPACMPEREVPDREDPGDPQDPRGRVVAERDEDAGEEQQRQDAGVDDRPARRRRWGSPR